MLVDMRPASLWGHLWLAMILCFAPAVEARRLHAEIAQLESGVGSLANIRIDVDWPDGAAQGRLRFRADRLDFPSLSYQARAVDWQCPLQRIGAQGWRCAGGVSEGGTGKYPLAVQWSPDATDLELKSGASRLAYRGRAASPDLSRIELERIPVAWLKAYLASLWSEGRWTQGRLDGTIDIRAPSSGPFVVQADLKLQDLGLETPDGWLAAASVAGGLRIGYRQQGARRSIETRISPHAGEFLAQNFYTTFPASGATLMLRMEQNGQAPWRVPLLQWRDGEVLKADGQGALDGGGALSDLDLRLSFGDLATARDRYLSGFLAPAGFSDLVLTGQAQAELSLRGGALDKGVLQLHGVNAVDSKQRFSFADVGGDLRWTHGADALDSALGWDAGAIYGIGLGPAKFPFASQNGALRLVEPAFVDVLGGRVSLDRFDWQPPTGEHGAHFQLAANMQALDLGSLSQRLGWPPFTGTLGGRIPSARYADNILTLDGGLQMSLFGGTIQLSDLVMERPFGVAPTLSADVGIQDIDLEPMTAAFGFGTITGRLDGHINDVRLVDWSPVAFNARLESDRAWKGKRRISQRAVKDISSVAGSGLIAGLQEKVLKIFEDFGYARIGIGCKLKDNVCTMDGVGSAGDGYIIVAGEGLPRIQVVGFRRRVDWPTLVARLQAATQGQAPVIK